MSNRVALLLVFLSLAVAVCATWSLTMGQGPAPPGPMPPAPLPAGVAAEARPLPAPAAAPRAPVVPARAEQSGTDTPPAAAAPQDLSKYTPLQKQMYLSVQRGADWLFRANRPEGRFDYGYVPALAAVMEGDHYLRQAGAAFALARAARFTGDERHAARARQAILTLLGDTTVQAGDQNVRHTALPGSLVN